MLPGERPSAEVREPGNARRRRRAEPVAPSRSRPASVAAAGAGSAAAARGPAPGPSWPSRAICSSRAIARSPSIRAGSSGGRSSISRATRSRIWSAKCGVAAPTSSRMSSTVTGAPGRAGRGARRRSRGSPWPLTRTISVSSSILRLHVDADRGLVAHEPGVIVDAAHGVEPVAGLDVEQVAPRASGGTLGRVDAAAAARTCRSPRARAAAAASWVRSAFGEHQAVAGVLHAPAEGPVRVAREGDRVVDRVCGRRSASPSPSLLSCATHASRDHALGARARRCPAAGARWIARVGRAGSESLSANSTASPDLAAQAAAGIAKLRLVRGAITTFSRRLARGLRRGKRRSRRPARTGRRPVIDVVRRPPGAPALPIRSTCAPPGVRRAARRERARAPRRWRRARRRRR